MGGEDRYLAWSLAPNREAVFEAMAEVVAAARVSLETPRTKATPSLEAQAALRASLARLDALTQEDPSGG
jgi:hypothetical protein